MISNPAGADSHPADVYALGKTLWVLATGQTYPPEGPQPAGVPGLAIDDSARTRATCPRAPDRAHDAARPKCAADQARSRQGVARLDRDSDPDAARDVSAIRNKLRAKMATEISAVEMRERRREAYAEAWEALRGALRRGDQPDAPDVHHRPALTTSTTG